MKIIYFYKIISYKVVLPTSQQVQSDLKNYFQHANIM